MGLVKLVLGYYGVGNLIGDCCGLVVWCWCFVLLVVCRVLVFVLVLVFVWCWVLLSCVGVSVWRCMDNCWIRLCCILLCSCVVFWLELIRLFLLCM